MRSMVRWLAGLLLVVVLLLLAGLMLPRHIEVSRDIVIDAPPAAVWPLVSDLRRFNEWSPWAAIDPAGTTYRLEGADTGVGQILHWASAHPDVGTGRHEIVEIDPARAVTARLEFGETGTARATIILIPAGRGTEVTWDFETDVGFNPVARWIGLMFDSWVGNDYEKGLARLKVLAEQ